MDELVTTDIDAQGMATLALSRTDKHNALNQALIEAFSCALKTLAKDESVRGLIIRSRAKHFCTGADINDMQASIDFDRDQNIADASRLGKLLLDLYRFPKPTICVVHGACYGGGIGIVACCDIAICESQASFCFSEAKLGLIPAMISPYIVKAIGARAAKAHFLSAEVFDGPKAYEMGLCYDVVSEEGLEERLEKLTRQIAHNGPGALTEIGHLIDFLEGQPIHEQTLEKTASWIAKIRASKEGQEGLHAFLEKRQPHWIKKI